MNKFFFSYNTMFFFLQNYNINQLFLLTSESMTVRSYGGGLGAQLDHTLEAHLGPGASTL